VLLAAATPLLAAPQKEIDWVDAYHRQVWEVLSPRLAGQEEELAWLQQATAPL
jgi:Xaa-Pro aminopeptidase